MNLNRVPDFTVNPSWTSIGKLFIGVLVLAFGLTVAVAVAQPMGWLDGLHAKLKQIEQQKHQPKAASPYSAPIGE